MRFMRKRLADELTTLAAAAAAASQSSAAAAAAATAIANAAAASLKDGVSFGCSVAVGDALRHLDGVGVVEIRRDFVVDFMVGGLIGFRCSAAAAAAAAAVADGLVV